MRRPAIFVDGVHLRLAAPARGRVRRLGSAVCSTCQRSRVSALRLIGTLSYAYNVPQGQTVATCSVGDSVPIRAGIELAERAYDRPSLNGLVQHQRAPVAFDFEETTPQGEDYIAHLYEASLDVPLEPGRLAHHHANRSVSAGRDRRRWARSRLGWCHVARPGQSGRSATRLDGRRIHNANALPRAYVLPRAQAFSPARHPDRPPHSWSPVPTSTCTA